MTTKRNVSNEIEGRAPAPTSLCTKPYIVSGGQSRCTNNSPGKDIVPSLWEGVCLSVCLSVSSLSYYLVDNGQVQRKEALDFAESLVMLRDSRRTRIL